jgi:Zn-dependent protease with chaperone function
MVSEGRREFVASVVHARPPSYSIVYLNRSTGLWLSMANLIVLLGSSAFGTRGPGRGLAELGNVLILRWQRAAEYTCDRAAQLVVQDERVVVSALMKLAGGSASYAAELNIDEYIAQADEFDRTADTRMGRLVAQGMNLNLAHPFPVHRVRELKRWSTSNVYRQLLRNGRKV